ncbi:protein of unknown function [Limnospira indica PCC 8005]|uniref:Uncharacterized protein n=1 Tax=Limnospira indica PCC 8005 TaxID=376219 RepID=A0A9P1NXG6_9CYAN|nr:protein of unknown function [Limnospira indica PCC 8005]
MVSLGLRSLPRVDDILTMGASPPHSQFIKILLCHLLSNSDMPIFPVVSLKVLVGNFISQPKC